jgi:hypothetical protein
MALSTYTELKAAIADWLDRTDLTTQIVDFITLAEAEFNRTLFVPQREEVSSASASDGTITLPDDFWSMRSLYIDSDPKTYLEQMNMGELRNRYSASATGRPQNFALQSGNELVLAPSPDTAYTLVLNYWQTIPALSASVASNWLLDSYPDIYLYGSILQSAAFLADDDRIPRWRGALGQAIGQLQDAGNKRAWGSTPVRIRSPYCV